MVIDSALNRQNGSKIPFCQSKASLPYGSFTLSEMGSDTDSDLDSCPSALESKSESVPEAESANVNEPIDTMLTLTVTLAGTGTFMLRVNRP